MRLIGALPESLRRRALQSAFDRARDAFNRGDIEAVTALFADDVEYVPPPALGTATLHGRAAVIDFWKRVFERYPCSAIENLSLREAAPGRFVRTARIRHREHRREPSLEYTILQTTELRGGRVVRQVNEALDG